MAAKTCVLLLDAQLANNNSIDNADNIILIPEMLFRANIIQTSKKRNERKQKSVHQDSHLDANLHPAGGLIGLGTSPSKRIRVFSRAASAIGSGIGIAESKACVYG